MDYSIISIDGNRNGKETRLCVKQYCVVRTPMGGGDSSGATTSLECERKINNSNPFYPISCYLCIQVQSSEGKTNNNIWRKT